MKNHSQQQPTATVAITNTKQQQPSAKTRPTLQNSKNKTQKFVPFELSTKHHISV